MASGLHELVIRRVYALLPHMLPRRELPPADPHSRAELRKTLLLARLELLAQQQTDYLLALSSQSFSHVCAQLTGLEIQTMVERLTEMLLALELDVDSAIAGSGALEADYTASVLPFPDRGERGEWQIDAGMRSAGELPLGTSESPDLSGRSQTQIRGSG